MMFPFPGQQEQPGTPYPGPDALYSASFPGVPEGPLGDLRGQVANVLNAADSHHVYLPTGPGGPILQVPRGHQPSILRGAAYGAMAGFAGALVWRAMKRRKVIKGEFTHPFFRFLMLWWVPVLAGFGLSMAWPTRTVWCMGIAFVLGTVLSLAYFIYRVTGYGRWNSRRPGDPRRGAHRAR